MSARAQNPKVCLRCGRQNPPEAFSCRRCGETLREHKVSAKREKRKARLSPAVPPIYRGEEAISHAQPGPVLSGVEGDIALDDIYCGDCLQIMKRMPDDLVDLVVTSPPYNFGLDGYDAHKDTKEWGSYFETLNQIWRECYRVLKTGGRLCVVVQPLFSDYIPTHHIISQQLRDIGYLFKAEIVWEKHNYNCKYTAWGSWKSPSMPYLKYTWEFIEVFCKGSQKKKGSRELADITPEEFKKWVLGKWEVAPENRMKEFGHPSMFPEEIPYRLMRLFSYVGDVVLDPFNGVGTTTLVARKLSRRYIGIDISPAYCARARERIAH